MKLVYERKIIGKINKIMGKIDAIKKFRYLAASLMKNLGTKLLRFKFTNFIVDKKQKKKSE